MSTPTCVQTIGAAFEIEGRYLSALPYGSGHINDTYAATYQENGVPVRYIHQRINHLIFKNPAALMENIARVTAHQQAKLLESGQGDRERRSLTIIRSREGLPYHVDAEGNTWRTYRFIENARTYDAIEHPRQAFEAAKAFGAFARQLTDLPGERLHETIPDFHHTPKRLEALEAAVAADPHGRAKEARCEIDFALARAEVTRVLLQKHAEGLIPERITHNDTKLNNVMLDDETQEGICVIDLDTVMPGLALYDFGDMVRTATCPRPEDETDLSLVTMQMPMFEALVDGYLTNAHPFLTPTEREHLAFSGRLITLEIGIRFLTDFLLGDTYFKIKRERHNLERCRSQFALVASIEAQEAEMNERVAAWKP
ncbi:MAG TPA: aminoglycoside phosphotransferase family protein [Chthoniobacteraceae bacterium]|nr:aminoglycoside phosphotransferase family protein [Chthoniobacteraceae bacterium]